MRYSKFYLDQFFNSISEYHSKVELLILANSIIRNTEEIGWIIALNQLMNWQSMSDRSGVWTYYEVLDKGIANYLINLLEEYKERDILVNYCKGIDNHRNEELMDEVDLWIRNNEMKIYRIIEGLLIKHKDWFYSYSIV